jgi:hypothetical protein
LTASFFHDKPRIATIPALCSIAGIVSEPDDIYEKMMGDGRGLLHIVGLALIFSGCFAIFVAVTRFFLPHDLVHIGFDADALALLNPRLVDFMFHNRAAWGGSLISVGILWLWLVHFPLSAGNHEAWRILRLFGIVGFSTFLCFVGYGYFDLWHGVATVGLLPFFILGLWRAKTLVDASKGTATGSVPARGYGLLLWVYACGLLFAGIAILFISITSVYVPEDLAFMALCGADIESFSERLTPVIAHDRSSFGGSLLTMGITLILIFRKLPLTYSLWQSLLLSGLSGFGAAIGIHYYIGYTDIVHLAPAWLGLIIFIIAIVGTRKIAADPGLKRRGAKSSDPLTLNSRVSH